MISTIIIEDQNKSIEALQEYLASYCPSIHLVSTVKTVSQGVVAIAKHRPQLVLLDLNLKDGSGFDLLKRVQSYQFNLIIISAYDDPEYTLQALNASKEVFGYLVKPIEIDKLVVLIKNLEMRLNTKTRDLNHLPIIQQERILFFKDYHNCYISINLKEIQRISAQDNIVKIYLSTQEEGISLKETLKDLEQKLKSFHFFRCHYSNIININSIEYIIRKENGGIIHLENGDQVPLSDKKKSRLFEIIDLK